MINNYTAIGNITRDIEVRRTTSGKSVVSFTIAINKAEGADFIPCVAFDKQADNLAQYCEKGSTIGISGKLQSRMYEDKNGQNRTVIEVVAYTIQYLSRKNDDTAKQPRVVEDEFVVADDFLPF